MVAPSVWGNLKFGSLYLRLDLIYVVCYGARYLHRYDG